MIGADPFDSPSFFGLPVNLNAASMRSGQENWQLPAAIVGTGISEIPGRWLETRPRRIPSIAKLPPLLNRLIIHIWQMLGSDLRQVSPA